MSAATLMIQGTASSVGKSVLVAGLCRLFARRGLRVAPFKSQNMSLNAGVTVEGLEIGRAQMAQAEAARVLPRVDMNPILLKPEGDDRSQVILRGRAIGSLTAREYFARRDEFREVIADCFASLRSVFDLIIIEGAGSPAEINLRHCDLVNMHVAHLAAAPVLLVGDIDRGGVFASLVGTLDLLDAEDRARVKGLIINRFRGDASLLTDGLTFLEERTGLPVLGVVPYVHDLGIAEEDAVSVEARARRVAPPDHLDIAVVAYPQMSNFDDVLPLEREPGVTVRYVREPADAGRPDLLILPGAKQTLPALLWLRRSGWEPVIARRIAERRPVLGICGGCQILSQRIDDPEGIESDCVSGEGLGYLPLAFEMRGEKRTTRVRARIAMRGLFAPSGVGPIEAEGYEIHVGRVSGEPAANPAFEIVSRNGAALNEPDGAAALEGCVVGTMIHGLFAGSSLRHALLHSLRERAGRPVAGSANSDKREALSDPYDRLADVLESHLDLPALNRLLSPSIMKTSA